jgi:hypothetical protein
VSCAGQGVGNSGEDLAPGKISTNGLALDMAALARLDMGPLGTWRTKDEAVVNSPSLEQLLARPAGLEHVEYLALCALDRGTELVTRDSAGAEVSFPGLYGLAPEWVNDGCGPSCQRWMTACLVAHANAFGYRVEISLRGAHPGFAWDRDIEAGYPVQEGAFYGNVFDREQPVAYACAGRALVDFDQEALDPDGRVGEVGPDEYLTRRVCTAGGPCGLEQTGLCHFLEDLVSTCAVDAGEDRFYGDCSTAAAGSITGAPTIGEVITTYLAGN